MEKRSDQQIRLLGLFLFAFYAAWSCWAALLVQCPGQFDAEWIRALTRIVLWIIPACLFVQLVEGPPVLERLGFRARAGEAIWLGLAVSIVLTPTLGLVRHGFATGTFVFPTGPWTWLSTILLAPLAEEMVFRGLVYRLLAERRGVMQAVFVSSVLFALIHLPYWWLSGSKPGFALWLSLLEIFGIGILLAGLFQWKHSIWMPFIYHAANNFMSVAFS